MELQHRYRAQAPVSDVFPADANFHHWRLGFRQSSFRHITQGPPARRPQRLDPATGSLACYFPSDILSDRSKPLDPGISSKFLPSTSGLCQSAMA